MSNRQETQIEKRSTSKSSNELLSKIRLLAKEYIQPTLNKVRVNQSLELQEAMSVLNQVELASNFARNRSLQKSASRGLNRLLLERNLGKLKFDLGEKCKLESSKVTLRQDPTGKLDPKSVLDEKRKLKKAEEAMRRLLALNEC
jgi:hypothetical protein